MQLVTGTYKAEADQFFDLGVKYLQVGKAKDALDCYRKVIDINPCDYEAYYNMGIAFGKLGRLREASDCYRKAIGIRPDFVPSYNNLGAILKLLGEEEQAMAYYQKLVVIQPDNAQAFNRLGLLMKSQGKLDDALNCFSEAANLDPTMAEVFFNLADLCKAMGDIDRAISFYRQALSIKPDYLQALNNLGIAYGEKGSYAEAVQCYRHAVQLNPNIAEIYSNLGNALKSQGELREAIACYRRALVINPQMAEIHHHLGTALQLVDQTDEAIASYEQAIRLRQNFAEAYCDLGNAFRDRGDLGPSLRCCDKAIRIKPNYAPAYMGRGILRLLNGELGKAWDDYEWRFKADGNNARLLEMFDHKRWSGSFYVGKTLLIYSEQGLGDTLQFIRYLPMVKSRGGNVVLATYASLINLIQGFRGIDRLVAITRNLNASLDYDFSLPIMSLPHIFNTHLDTIPSDVPYLHADPEKQAKWRQMMTSAGLKVGLVWKGNSFHSNDHRRSLPLNCLAAVAEIPGIQCFSLQKGELSAEEKKLLQKLNCVELGNGFEDFSDTAGAIANLDLLISVDTSVVHLAGAMGRNVWTLLPFAPDWRWMLNRQDSPWYPSMRLFRQEEKGNWNSVIDRVLSELKRQMLSSR